MSSFKKKIISGLKWVSFSRYAQKGMTFLSFIILARILEPSDFGLFAMAFIVIDGLGIFKNLGINSALIQRKDDVEQAAHTAFWMVPILGISIFLLLYVLAPTVSIILKEQQLTPVIRCLGIIFVLGSVQSVPQALLSKQMKFKELEIRDLISVMLYCMCAITLAYWGLGIWSLVYAYLLRRFTLLILTWKIAQYKPRFVFNKRIAWELVHFGKFIFGSSLVYFFVINIDNFFIGRMLGVTMLGFYALAYNISDLTSTHLSQLIGKVMFPAYAKIQDDKEMMKRTSLKIIKAISIVSLPFGIIIMMLAEEIISIVYGTKWLPVAPALKILALCSIFLPFVSPLGSIFIACGKAKWNFYLSLIIILVMTISIPVMVSYQGLLGAAIAVTFSRLITIPVRFILVKDLIGLRINELVRTIRPVVISSTVMAMLIYLLKTGFEPYHVNDIIFLGTIILMAGIVYFFALLIVDKQGMHDIKIALYNV